MRTFFAATLGAALLAAGPAAQSNMAKPEKFTAFAVDTSITASRANATTVDITPYDRAYVGGGACPATITTFTHVVSLAFGARGTGTINIRHRLKSVSGGDSLATITRTVVVE